MKTLRKLLRKRKKLSWISLWAPYLPSLMIPVLLFLFRLWEKSELHCCLKTGDSQSYDGSQLLRTSFKSTVCEGPVLILGKRQQSSGLHQQCFSYRPLPSILCNANELSKQKTSNEFKIHLWWASDSNSQIAQKTTQRAMCGDVR